MRIKRFFQVGGAVLTLLALFAFLLLPGRVSASAAKSNANTSIKANIYLTGAMLQPLFQSNINQQIPQVVSKAISSMVGQLPKQDQGWASQMADALLQPSARLVSLTPQAQGLLVTLQISLYQGDPKPTTANILIGFSVSDPSTIQVTALPINGKPGLVNGPLLTFHVPIGTLNAISAAVNCGDADLNIGLNFPVALGTASRTNGQIGSPVASGGMRSLSASLPTQTPPTNTSSYIEIPASSLAQLGSSIGSLTINTSLSAQNIRVGVQGSNLMLTSDIYWYGFGIGTAVSTLAPGASNGNLVMHVTNTDLQILGGFVSFPINSYNQQIEQAINSKLNGALIGKFTVMQAAVGPNPHLPCAAADSLVLGGTIALG